jgi:hypothetical protein
MPELQEFSRMMDRGSVLCTHIAKSELILGYTATCNQYTMLASELRSLPAWIYQTIATMNN